MQWERRMVMALIKERIVLIAGVIYIAGMFPLWYLFNVNPASTFSASAQAITYISEFGCLLLMGAFVIGALVLPSSPSPQPTHPIVPGGKSDKIAILIPVIAVIIAVIAVIIVVLEVL
jgi:hypothetical protein